MPACPKYWRACGPRAPKSSLFGRPGRDAGAAAGSLPMVASGHLLTDPISICLSTYCLIEELARRRGYDPDNPSNLKKVTETV